MLKRRWTDPISLFCLNQILAAINAAQPIGSAQLGSSAIDCTAGVLLATSFLGDNFVLCAMNEALTFLKIVGSDLNIDVHAMDAPASISKPTQLSDTCDSVFEPTQVSETTRAILSGASVSTFIGTGGSNASLILPQASCSCSSTPRPCLFIHGLGSSDDSGLHDSSSYFGDIAQSAPCCSSVQFSYMNTNDFAWTDAGQQQKLCDYALQVSGAGASSKVVENTILVAHSMGNLMLGGALANGRCSLASTTDWVALSGPMGGSMGSDYLQKNCASNGIVDALASLLGKCPANRATVSLAYEGESYASDALDSAYESAQAAYSLYVTAAICSNSYAGLLSKDQAAYQLGGSVIPHKSSENDGVVTRSP